MTVKIERLEGKTLEMSQQFGFFVRCDEVGLVAKALGRFDQGAKEIALVGAFTWRRFCERGHDR